jgi:hypothetical protein
MHFHVLEGHIDVLRPVEDCLEYQEEDGGVHVILDISIVDQWMLLRLLFAVVVPIFYMGHMFMQLGLLLLWLLTRDRQSLKVSKFALVPMFSISFWFFCLFISLVYLITRLLLVWKAGSKKPKESDNKWC